MATTVSVMSRSQSVRTNSVNSNVSRLMLLKDITKNLMGSYFPDLNSAPNSLYVAMATWQKESNFNIHFKSKNRSYADSRHLTSTDPNNSSLMGKGYYFSNVIQNYLKTESGKLPASISNIQQGFYPHGISACMGCYHVAGTPNNVSEFRPGNSKIISDLGIEVSPGSSIIDLFPDTEFGYARSIGSGLIILNSKYKTALRLYNGDKYTAIVAAVGLYVGKLTALDANGYSPKKRIQEIFGTGRVSTTLASIGLQLDSGTQIASTVNSIVNSSNTRVAASGGGQASNSSQTRTAGANAQASPTTLPGCA